ncbi:MAG: phage/plasmid primase, P4 family [Thermoplasmata archaeon]
MSDLPAREEALQLLEEENNALIRHHLSLEPSELGEEAYEEALREALEREGHLIRLREDSPHTYYAERLLRSRTLVTLEDTEEVMVYDEGAYHPHGEAVVRAWTEAAYRESEGKSPKSHLVNEVLAIVHRRTYVPRDGFNPPGLLCLRNGVLNPLTGELRPHAPEPRFTIQLPVSFDSGASCPRFLRFLGEVLPNEEGREIAQLLFGYTLELGNRYHRAFMFHGSGANGKSTLQGVLRALLGPKSVSAETLQTLSKSRFATASLWGRLANICPDIPATPLRYTDVFKGLTGGDAVRGERKFRDTFEFVNPAKLIFSANELPPVDDKTYAFWRRWIIVDFPNRFVGDDANPRLLETLTLDEELSGVLNWALAGLDALRARGGFPEGQADDLREEWQRRSDSLYWFLQERVEVDPQGWVAKADFNEAYAAFCEAKDVAKRSIELVGHQLPEHLAQVRTTRKRRGGPQVWGWAGIRLREEGEEDG